MIAILTLRHTRSYTSYCPDLHPSDPYRPGECKREEHSGRFTSRCPHTAHGHLNTEGEPITYSRRPAHQDPSTAGEAVISHGLETQNRVKEGIQMRVRDHPLHDLRGAQ